MLRNLAIWVLLPSMLLNGLWMVCNPISAADSPVSPEEFADCIRICAAFEAEFGKICLIWPGNTTPSITVFDFGAAILPDEIVLQPAAMDEQLMPAWSTLYANPSLFTTTPPPKA